MKKIELTEWQYNKLIQATLWFDIQNRGGLSGQVITEYKCVICLTEQTNSDTNTPRICPTCTKKESKRIRALWEKGEL